MVKVVSKELSVLQPFLQEQASTEEAPRPPGARRSACAAKPQRVWAYRAKALARDSQENLSGMSRSMEPDYGSGGDIIFSDFAEHFDLADIEAEPGTVMAIDQDGSLRPSKEPYDKKVAGVVSGAGNFRPAIILGKRGPSGRRMAIALVGKVYCKVDAKNSPIEVGDLLTTSDTPGHAMKADDPFKAFGSVIGKALGPMQEGNGLIPILVSLQ